ncbi:recombinase family protein [Levilactobacillus brevis]|uniref:recombinase family protein n=1 Tax=Levilactobacillus brevis TaxID=1580 RepID=UPI0011185C1F|nr:recombinase family protein [Levilactobacillus brevis]QCZ42413.1 cassette chromosome recombinase B [Levilactobacillus brevis]
MNEVAVKQKRAVAYVRVSTTEQAEQGYSIDAQIQTIKQYCQRQNLDLVEVYADRGISGKSLNKRQQLQALLAGAQRDEFEMVVIWKNSRLARNVKLLLEIVDTLQAHNIELYSISENFRIDTASGKLMLQVMASVSEFERNEISENVLLGMKKRARDGYTNGNRVLGYDNVKLEDGTKTLSVNEDEARIVRFIFDAYLQRQGLRSIANVANHRGYQTKRGNSFSTTAIRDILRNPVYVGLVQYGKYEQWELKGRRGKMADPILVRGKHPAIISQATWDQVQTRLKAQSRTPKWNQQGANSLTGLLRCPECGGPMAASNTTNTLKDGTKKRIRYYSCANFRNKGTTVCHANSIRADEAEALVSEKLMLVLCEPNIGQKVVQQMTTKWSEQQQLLQQLILSKQQNIDELGQKKQRLLDTIEEEPLVKADLEPRIHQLTVEQVHIEADIQVLQNRAQEKPEDVLAQNVDQLLRLVASIVSEQATKTLKAIYQVFIESVTFDRQKKLVWVHMRFDDEVIASLKQYEKGTSKTGVPFLHGDRAIKFSI